VNLEQLYQGPLVVDIAIGFITLETLLLWAWHKFTGRGLALPDCVLTILSGACLMLALRCALTPDGWPGMALFLIAAGIAHGADLRTRWRDNA
jgi:hypothetical protein